MNPNPTDDILETRLVRGRLTAVLPSVCAVLVGMASFAISYDTLRLEAIKVAAVEGGWPSYLLPLILDGGVIAGSAVLWKAGQDRRARPWFAYLFVSVLVLLSVVVNVSHAGPSLLAKVVASLPPLVLLGCLELVVVSHRDAPATTQAAERAAQAPGAPTAVMPPATASTPVPAPLTPVATPRAARPREPRPPRPTSPRRPSNANRVRELFAEHLAAGGVPTDPSLSRTFAAQLDMQPASVRRLLGELRRTAAASV